MEIPKSQESFQQISDNKMEDEIFPRVKVETGQIWKAYGEQEIILSCTKIFESNNKEVRTALNRFDGITGLMKQNKAKEEVAMMIYMTSHTVIAKPVAPYYAIITDGDTHEKTEDKTMLQSLLNVKHFILKRQDTNLALPELDGTQETMFMRMLEYLLVKTNITMIMHEQANTYKITSKSASSTRTPLTGNANTFVKPRKS